MLACLRNCIRCIRNLELIVVADEDEEQMKELKIKKSMIKSFTIFQSCYILVKIITNFCYTFIQDNKICRYFVILNLLIELIAVTLLLFLLRSRQLSDSLLLDMHYDQIDQNNEQNDGSEDYTNDNHESVPIGRIVPASEVPPEAMPFLHQVETNQNRYEPSNLDSQTDFRQADEPQNASRTPQMPYSDNDDDNIHPSINALSDNDND